ncbi:hypothetical protein ELI00_18440 [Rhizobium ruizarguesonis]|jgi:hypothetical protein|uniref:hypothetical protein n=1 Tax=Rhizobium ruizarguesonis TaxID=2081791 RepID=UPI00035FC6FA|nr:hypothetical protein [Rhizobium ruizarguesonis]NEH66226.1 hypothetical protein [Rhizobium ruizarguesonis]NEH80471.1 hypothetical protein [Rhizobium ruizarguesonis]NEI76078.1 hypothetical protein [Rhizobium ruizarguesonis]NEJ90797.1 hypothetical protein [Rhizobium ruizarguesonis]NEJ96996.1 hypothetical protein [Rhizobium ruizarguesonis]
MMKQLLLTTVGVPFFLGMAVALASMVFPARRGFIIALLIPLAAVVIHLMLEGMPVLPPVSAKQKLPIILLFGAGIFAIPALVRRPLPVAVSTMLVGVALALSGWLLGKNVLVANSTKSIVVLAVFVVTTAAIGPAIAKPAGARRGEPSALATALLSVSIAAALSAALGAFVGMAQIDGALAALTGGWLLVNYISYFRGDDHALALRGFEGLAFAAVISVHLIMTALFAPKAAPAAIIFAVLPLVVGAFILLGGIAFHRLPRFLRPIAAGIATAVPATIAITIAAVLFQG